MEKGKKKQLFRKAESSENSGGHLAASSHSITCTMCAGGWVESGKHYLRLPLRHLSNGETLFGGILQRHRPFKGRRKNLHFLTVPFYQTLERLETKLLINARDVPKIYPIPVCVISLTSFLIQTVRQ